MKSELVNEQADLTYTILSRRRSLDIFVCMLAMSLLLHIAMSALFMIPGRSSVGEHPPMFVDLAAFTPESRPVTSSPVAEIPVQEPAEPPVESSPREPSRTEALQQSVATSLENGAKSPETLHENAIGIGMTSGYFGSFAEGESLRDDIRVYYFSLMRRINEAWWLQSGGNPSVARHASLNLVVSREGKIVVCELMQSSGNYSQDQLLLAAVKKAQPLPPLPLSYTGTLFTAPIRFNPPLNLMLPDFLKKPVRPHG